MSITENPTEGETSSAAAATAPPVPEKETKSEPMAINVKDSNGNEILFKVRPQTKFEKLFTAYCDRQGQKVGTCRFYFDGSRLLNHESPLDKEMIDGDTIDVFQEQTGGSPAREDASPSPPPPVAMTPGPRATGYLTVYEKTLAHTLDTVTYEHFAACFPTVAQNAPEQLKHLHKQMMERLRVVAKNEFDLITAERAVIHNLNSLEDLISTARRRSARSTDSEHPPEPPHLLPATTIASAHLAPVYAAQQSQLNARLQTVQSQNATLAKTIADQKGEIEALLAQVEGAVGDLDLANGALGGEVDVLAADARQAEAEMIDA
ncbi:hypothetical protein BP5796_04939 [Coleophoma crateriformis]|uniref:Ubiquitin-like domain-containing protein n=1 Tax=Coleophoma crateriformis TaxID=565419 RepID=A0A3D8SCF1_9HELO|nr:hypothetical protein BP5796_04939 [Coleophoma crateriformis]